MLAGAVAVGLTMGGTAYAKSAKSIVEKANIMAYYQGKDGRSEARLTIVDSQGRKRLRQFTILRRNEKPGGDQDFLVLFTRPADVRRTVFMVAKHVGSDDDRWMYLPALDLVKRIAAADKRTSFVGSHFLYEDISGRGLHEDRHELVKTTDKHYVIRATPKDSGAVEFKHFKVWIDKKTMLPMKMEYYDKSGKAYRRIESLKVQNIQGHPTTTVMKASDLESGGYTISEMRGIKYDIDLPEAIFAERSLRNPPRRWFSAR
jgi:hypothetical protein